MPCSCRGTLTIVGQEDAPQVGSILPVGLSLIFDGRSPSVRIGVTNSRISVRGAMI